MVPEKQQLVKNKCVDKSIQNAELHAAIMSNGVAMRTGEGRGAGGMAERNVRYNCGPKASDVGVEERFGGVEVGVCSELKKEE